jgi:peptidoglycan hydrolase-like protein with peptidoglycan-binding domain
MVYNYSKNFNRGEKMDKNEFISLIVNGAVKGHKEFGILASLTLAQAILESGWGESQLSRTANNLFGIKAFYDWEGEVLSLPTTEYYNDESQTVTANFRKYETLNDSILDHSRLLSYTRYIPVRNTSDYREACYLVWECGYATDPDYPKKLIAIIEDNQLQEFDTVGDNVKEISSFEVVRAFQILCNTLGINDIEGKDLAADNILGWRTKGCLAQMPVLTLGTAGKIVEFIQRALGMSDVDGVFGPITKSYVLTYQTTKGLAVDGIVGYETWHSIVI